MEGFDEDYESIPGSSLAINMIAGAMAGMTEHSVMYPFDSIKTRMQFMTSNPQGVYTGVLNAISRISTTEGVRTLWKGIHSVLLGSGPAHALSFSTYEYCKQVFRNKANKGHQILADASAGACATIIHDGFMTPFDVVKQRMQIQGSSFSGILSCSVSIAKTEGMRAFYLSYPTTLLMSIPFQSIHFATYEVFKKMLNPSEGYDPKTHILSGALAGAIASLFTQPMDVVKTLLQTRGVSSDLDIRNVDNFQSAVKLIYKRQGWNGFIRGLGPRLLTNMPATAICWTTYEFMKMFLIQ